MCVCINDVDCDRHECSSADFIFFMNLYIPVNNVKSASCGIVSWKVKEFFPIKKEHQSFSRLSG